MNQNDSFRKWTEFDREEPWSESKREPAEYCTILIVKNPKRIMRFFFDILDGEEVFCKVVKEYKTERIREFTSCRLTGTKIFTTRSIPTNEAIII